MMPRKKGKTVIKKEQAPLDNTIKQELGDKLRTKKDKLIIEYEFIHDISNTSFKGTVTFAGMKAMDASFITVSDETKAMNIFCQSFKLVHQGILSPWFVDYCGRLDCWVLCYERFDCTLDAWKNLDVLHKSANGILQLRWCNEIRDLLTAILYIHQEERIHNGLKDLCNYVWKSDSIKIINIMGERGNSDDTAFNESKFKDLKEFGDMLSTILDQSATECQMFLGYFGNPKSQNYEVVINKLITHPYLRSVSNRLKYFFQIGRAIKIKTLERPDDFIQEIQTGVFNTYLDWNKKSMSEELSEVYTHIKDNGTKVKYDGKKVEDLIRFLTNVYKYGVKDGNFGKIYREISSLYENFLSRLHEIFFCKENPA